MCIHQKWWNFTRPDDGSLRRFESSYDIGARYFYAKTARRVIEPRRTKQPWDFRHRGARPLNTWRNRTNRIRKRGTEECRRAAWVHCLRTYTCTHRYVLERYLWHKRHADGNECPRFSDVPRIIVHPLRSSASNARARSTTRYFAFLRVV